MKDTSVERNRKASLAEQIAWRAKVIRSKDLIGGQWWGIGGVVESLESL